MDRVGCMGQEKRGTRGGGEGASLSAVLFSVSFIFVLEKSSLFFFHLEKKVSFPCHLLPSWKIPLDGFF